jgi:hypothetical protein
MAISGRCRLHLEEDLVYDVGFLGYAVLGKGGRASSSPPDIQSNIRAAPVISFFSRLFSSFLLIRFFVRVGENRWRYLFAKSQMPITSWSLYSSVEAKRWHAQSSPWGHPHFSSRGLRADRDYLSPM